MRCAGGWRSGVLTGFQGWHLGSLSRNLNQPLGHKALKKGLRIQKDGSVFVDDVIRALSNKPALRAEWVGQISRKSHLSCHNWGCCSSSPTAMSFSFPVLPRHQDLCNSRM